MLESSFGIFDCYNNRRLLLLLLLGRRTLISFPLLLLMMTRKMVPLTKRCLTSSARERERESERVTPKKTNDQVVAPQVGIATDQPKHLENEDDSDLLGDHAHPKQLKEMLMTMTRRSTSY